MLSITIVRRGVKGRLGITFCNEQFVGTDKVENVTKDLRLRRLIPSFVTVSSQLGVNGKKSYLSFI